MSQYSKLILIILSVFLMVLGKETKAQTLEEQRDVLNSRSSPVDQHYYVDSILRFSHPATKMSAIAHVLKAELLKTEEKFVDALTQLKTVTTSESSGEYPLCLLYTSPSPRDA